MTPPRAQPVRWSGDWYAAAVFVAIWAATLIPLLSVAATNARLVEAFSTDEAMQVNLLARALREHSWAIHFGAYGHLYFNLALLPLKLLSPVTERTIVITARALSLSAAAGLILCTFGWARRVHGTLTAWLAMMLVAFNPTVYAWAGVVHPDMLQALCLLIALFCTVAAFEKPTTGRILVSSVLAGLAFAAKYSGLFVLPLIASALLGRRAIASRHGADRRIGVIRAVTTAAAVMVLVGGLAIDGQWIVTHITADGHVDVPLPVSLDALVWIIRAFGALLVLAAATPWTWRLFRRWTSAETVFWGFAVAAAAFVMTFVVASPYSFVKLAFLKGLYYEAVETGAAINVLWVETWTRGVFTTVGLPIVVALAGTLLAWLVDRRRRSALEIILWGWIVVYILVLLAPVHELAVYYALPLVAPAAILAARGAIGITEILAWRLPRVPRRATAALAITILVGFELSSVAALSQIRRAALLRERAPVVLAGEWLTARVPPTSRVAYHYLTYVPPAFTNVAVTWGASRAWLTAFDPDVVVVNRDVVSGWHGPRNEESYSVCLERGTCGYECVFALDTIAIFRKHQVD